MKKQYNNKIINIIDKILEHNYFKMLCISIISCFLIFNCFSYIKSKINLHKKSNSEQIKINIDNFSQKLEEIESQKIKHIVKKGETLSDILFNLGLDAKNVNEILKTTKKIFDPRNIFQGQKIIIEYKTIITNEIVNNQNILVRKSIVNSISLSPDPEIIMIISRISDEKYKSLKKKKELVKKIAKYSGKIENSLFVDGTEAGISPNIMIEMINLYGFIVDFQRDIRNKDEFEILFEEYFDKNGEKIKDGNILFASLNLKTKNRDLSTYRHKYKNRGEYFNTKGSSVKRSLLVTPVNGARISSRFGMRRHPILGYRKKHKGLDFAAPTGTPTLAAGDGYINKIGYSRANGNYIFLKHNDTFETVYIHMSRFARNMKKGRRVKQGRVIGYVGATGMAKGPHLHYEIRKKGVSINPAKFRGTANITLKGSKLKEFKSVRDNINKLRNETLNSNLKLIK